jgi:cytidylate kinase
VKIAISGKSGCGNTTVSKLVSQKLGLKFINYTFKNMAEEKGMTFDEIYTAAQSDDNFDRFIDNKQKELASQGNCVIGSRLAVWLIDDADLKIFLTAPADVRAQRIHTREGGEYNTVLEKTIERDKKDNARYKSLYNIDNNDYSHVDMVIDTSKCPAENVADLIIRKAKHIIEKQ